MQGNFCLWIKAKLFQSTGVINGRSLDRMWDIKVTMKMRNTLSPRGNLIREYISKSANDKTERIKSESWSSSADSEFERFSFLVRFRLCNFVHFAKLNTFSDIDFCFAFCNKLFFLSFCLPISSLKSFFGFYKLFCFLLSVRFLCIFKISKRKFSVLFSFDRTHSRNIKLQLRVKQLQST